MDSMLCDIADALYWKLQLLRKAIKAHKLLPFDIHNEFKVV